MTKINHESWGLKLKDSKFLTKEERDINLNDEKHQVIKYNRSKGTNFNTMEQIIQHGLNYYK